MYHRYGTLMSDVWTDIECDPGKDIRPVTRRLQDLFGLSPYKELLLIDLRTCKELTSRQSRTAGPPKLRSGKTQPSIRSRLINGDCVEALKSLRSDSIDFCFADLPYNLRKRYHRCKDSLGEEEYFAWCNEWLSELCRVLKPGRTLAVLNVPQWAAKHFLFLSSIMDFQAWIVWDALGFPSRKIMPAHYAIVCFSKGTPRVLPGLSSPNGNLVERQYLKRRARFYCIRSSCVKARKTRGVVDYAYITDIWNDVHRLTHNSLRVNHPCQLPPLLMRRLYALYTKKGEAILDCFNGAGTSTIVAQQMSRKFIGIEISGHYHRLALKRHRLLTSGRDPFGKTAVIPKAKNSLVVRLPRQKYKVSKKTLQLEVKRIAAELGRMPQPEDVKVYTRFPMRYFNNYFTSWGEVCAAARGATNLS
ncbi:MAG: DNA methyltransferase [Pyrinomonadaceae bacterium]